MRKLLLDDKLLERINCGKNVSTNCVDGLSFSDRVGYHDVKTGNYYYVIKKDDLNHWYFVYADNVWNMGLFKDKTKYNFTIFRTNDPSKAPVWRNVSHNDVLIYATCV